MRVAITGIGVWAAAGRGVDEFWRTLAGGRSSLRTITRFDATDYPFSVAGELEAHEADSVPGKLVAQTDVWTRQGLDEVQLALADAALELDLVPTYRAGISIASSAGGVEFGQREIEKLWSKGPRNVSAYQSIAWFYAAAVGQASILFDVRGQCDAVVAEGAGGLDALGQAAWAVQEGGVDLMIAGGTDSALSPYGAVCQYSGGHLSDLIDPASPRAPFHHEADGWVIGEGGAVLTLESPEHARRRNARVRGHIVGYASSLDPPPWTGRPSSLRTVMAEALDHAALVPDAVDLVLADGSGITQWDEIEADALIAVFGSAGVPITVPKIGYGRLYSGGGPVDVATACLAMENGLIPSTPGAADRDFGMHLDLAAAPRRTEMRHVLVVARGNGGFNSCMVISK